jgi:succinyl-diaminopimelate desuccinylase
MTNPHETNARSATSFDGLEQEILELASVLIGCQSITPLDDGCQNVLIERLEALGFQCERLRFGDVENFWAYHGEAGPCLAFAGHTDVVPCGPLDKWEAPPFTPTVKDGMLFGRGAADMKGNLASMCIAAMEFVKKHPDHKGKIAMLVTGDEEGIAENGTRRVVDLLRERNEKINWCVVGEPSSVNTVGDTIKNGRRGSLTGNMTLKGIQGHVAYPERALNPIHQLVPALAELCATTWDEGNEYFPPTSFQVSNFHSGTGADNVIPADVELIFNFRFSPESKPEQLKSRFEEILKKHNLNYILRWRLSGQPFLTVGGKLLDATRNSIRKIIGVTTELSTSGGTSDARFIATAGTEVIEVGPINATIHKLNECVSLRDLTKLTHVYLDIAETLLQRATSTSLAP